MKDPVKAWNEAGEPYRAAVTMVEGIAAKTAYLLAAVMAQSQQLDPSLTLYGTLPLPQPYRSFSSTMLALCAVILGKETEGGCITIAKDGYTFRVFRGEDDVIQVQEVVMENTNAGVESLQG